MSHVGKGKRARSGGPGEFDESTVWIVVPASASDDDLGDGGGAPGDYWRSYGDEFDPGDEGAPEGLGMDDVARDIDDGWPFDDDEDDELGYSCRDRSDA
jgi:hypothetical protein